MKLGRKPRAFNNIPHYGTARAMARLAGVQLPPLPERLDQAAHLPGFVGMMLNDQLGDCTCAGRYHEKQLVTLGAQGVEITEIDTLVQQLYEEVGGYRPGHPETDGGAVEQDVLNHLVQVGSPRADGGRDRILAFFEVDVRNLNDVCRAIEQFGCVYIGFAVKREFMFEGPPNLWDARPHYVTDDGGHCVILTGFNRTDPDNPSFNVISWGSRQWVMTAAFWRAFVDEAYALVDPLWIAHTGLTPLGLNATQLTQLAADLRR